MMDKSKTFIKFLLYFLLFLFVTQNLYSQNNFTQAVDGEIDFSNIELDNNLIVNLDGHWELYWNRIIDPGGFEKEESDGFIYFPSLWNDHKLDNEYLDKDGFLTLRLKVKLKKKYETLAIKVPEMYSSYRLWVDDKIIAENGKVGTHEDSAVSEWDPLHATFIPDTNYVDITLQMSNYGYKFGGSFNPVVIGTEKAIHNHVNHKFAFDLVLFGSILIMSLYHFGLFYKRREAKSTLYFGALCFIIAFRSLLTGEMYFIDLFPNLNWEIFTKLNFGGIALIPPFLMMFIDTLFDGIVKKWFLKFCWISGLLFLLSVIIFPASIHSHILSPYYHGVIVIVGVYLTYVLFKAINLDKEGAIVVFSAFVFLFYTGVNDILAVTGILNSVQLFPFGLFVFIFAQSFILSVKFSNSFQVVKKLSSELKALNENLEIKVIERTRELALVNSELKEAIDNIKTLNGLLPICANCKMIRDDKGYWNQIEDYIKEHSEAEFSHSLCPDCAHELYPQLMKKKES